MSGISYIFAFGPYTVAEVPAASAGTNAASEAVAPDVEEAKDVAEAESCFQHVERDWYMAVRDTG